ncbi:non-heme iron oxygenase ferredoxin subunit [Pseudoxanthomonas spadix]|jgi:nitrite reductase/ring-hydroxylating ferredoxin subunit
MGLRFMGHIEQENLVELIACDEVEEDFGAKVEREGAPPLAVFRLGDEFFVIDDTCTHGDASLSDGELFSNGEVSCPFHGGTFDVRSGAACKYPCVVPIKTYRTRIINNSVWIDLS